MKTKEIERENQEVKDIQRRDKESNKERDLVGWKEKHMKTKNFKKKKIIINIIFYCCKEYFLLTLLLHLQNINVCRQKIVLQQL